MAYHYVKNGLGVNTADTSYATLQTGSFGDVAGNLVAANVYSDPQLAGYYSTPADGDNFLVSDAHSHSQELNLTLGFDADNLPAWGGTGIRLNYISVLDTNADQYSFGATLETGIIEAHGDIKLCGAAQSVISVKGFNLIAVDAFYITSLAGTGSLGEMVDCQLVTKNATAGDFLRVEGVGSKGILRQCGLKFGHADQYIQMEEATLIMDGVYGITGTALINGLLFSAATNGGFHTEIYNSDLSSFMAASSTLLDSVPANNDQFKLIMRACVMPTGWSVGTIAQKHYLVDIAGCDAGDGYYYFLYGYDNLGWAEFTTAQYMTTGDAIYYGTSRYSTKIVTSAETDDLRPFRFKIGTIPAQDLRTAKTISVEISGDPGLKDTDVGIEIVRQDITNQAMGVITSTMSATMLGVGNGSALTASSAVWNITTGTEYAISSNIGALTGIANSKVDVYAVVAKPSSTVYFDVPTIAAT